MTIANYCNNLASLPIAGLLWDCGSCWILGIVTRSALVGCDNINGVVVSWSLAAQPSKLRPAKPRPSPTLPPSSEEPKRPLELPPEPEPLDE